MGDMIMGREEYHGSFNLSQWFGLNTLSLCRTATG